jgi:hypothetical protein
VGLALALGLPQGIEIIIQPSARAEARCRGAQSRQGRAADKCVFCSPAGRYSPPRKRPTQACIGTARLKMEVTLVAALMLIAGIESGACCSPNNNRNKQSRGSEVIYELA